jgi:hypothetical protein
MSSAIMTIRRNFINQSPMLTLNLAFFCSLGPGHDGAILAAFIISGVVWIAPWVLIRSWTEMVGDVPSPDGKWAVILMVRNIGAVTDCSTQLSVVPAGGLLSREFALCRPGNVFIADGNDGTVVVDDRGFMNVKVVWQSPDLIAIRFPRSARVFKQEHQFQSVTITYNN